jgi:hypothetical protein
MIVFIARIFRVLHLIGQFCSVVSRGCIAQIEEKTDSASFSGWMLTFRLVYIRRQHFYASIYKYLLFLYTSHNEV